MTGLQWFWFIVLAGVLMSFLVICVITFIKDEVECGTYSWLYDEWNDPGIWIIIFLSLLSWVGIIIIIFLIILDDD